MKDEEILGVVLLIVALSLPYLSTCLFPHRGIPMEQAVWTWKFHQAMKRNEVFEIHISEVKWLTKESIGLRTKIWGGEIESIAPLVIVYEEIYCSLGGGIAVPVKVIEITCQDFNETPPLLELRERVVVEGVFAGWKDHSVLFRNCIIKKD